MRYSLSSVAILASSLLVTEVFAQRFDVRKRALYQEIDNVVVTEEVYVTEQADGSYQTGGAVAVGTSTLQGTAILVPETTSTPEPASTVAPSSSSSFVAAAASSTSSIPEFTPPTAISTSAAPSTTPSAAAVFLQAATSTPEPTTSVAAPTTSAAPTTLATIVVPTTTSSAAPVATTAVSSTSGKRGVAFNDASLTNAFTSSSKVSWAYNWGSSTSTIAAGLQFTPMLWGLNSWATSNWKSMASKAIAAGSTHLLGFNEPDLASQSNLDYNTAAQGWTTYMEPFAGKAKLVSPAVTNGGSPMGLTWLKNFLGSCSSCTVDAVAIHWYNGGDAAAFKQYVSDAYAAGGNRPVWVTEFQASGSVAEQQAFLTEVMAWMDSSSMVERYAYFMASDGILCTGNSLSALGNTFATS